MADAYRRISDGTWVLASQITGNSNVSLTACLDQEHREHESYALLLFCEGNPLVTSDCAHKERVMRHVFRCRDVCMRFETYMAIFPDISPCRLTDTCLKINADVKNLKAVLRLKDYRAVCRQDGRHFADDIFKCIFVSEDVWMSIKISRKFVRKGPINNKSSLVQVIAWPWTGDKPLPEPMMI